MPDRGDAVNGARLPVGPLVELVEAKGGVSVFGRHGNGSDARRRAYQRARQSGRLTVDAADRLVTALGRHPVELWGLGYHAVSEIRRCAESGCGGRHYARGRCVRHYWSMRRREGR